MLSVFALSLALLHSQFICSGAQAQPRTWSLIQAGNQAVSNSDWATAAPVYDQLVKSNPGRSLYWYYLAVSHDRLGNFDQAIRAYRTVYDLGNSKAHMIRQVASLQARLGQKQECLKTLRQMLAEGFWGWQDVYDDRTDDEVQR